MNALALSYPEGELIDPFGGQKDLFRQTLRAVDDARSRFHEDPLRTLRAGRFISVYDFNLDPDTFTALKDAARELQGVAPERIREELFKMLPGAYFSKGFDWMARGGVIEAILPELTGSGCAFRSYPGRRRGAGRRMQKDLSELMALPGETAPRANSWEALEHTVKTVDGAPPRLRVRLAALFHNLSELRAAHQNIVSVDPDRHSRMLLAGIQQKSLDASLRGHEQWSSDTHLCSAALSVLLSRCEQTVAY
jgi:tRNA nucleotidyltransferase/poly(A) polymerase